MQKQVKQIDFTGQTIFVGIDTHKRSWKVGILWNGVIVKVFSQAPDPKLLVIHLRKNYPNADYCCGYEAGFCGFWIHEQLKELGIRCEVLHAADIPTTDKERRQKTDARDCRKIAACLANPLIKGIHIPSKQMQKDRSVVRVRTKISQDCTRIRNRIKSHIYFFGFDIEIPKYWSRRFIIMLEQWRDEKQDTALGLLIEEYKVLRSYKAKALRELRILSKENRFEERAKILLSIPGIGMVGSMCFLTEIGDIRRFKHLDQLCSMIGIIPTTNASGDRMGVGRMTKRGKKEVKNVLIEAAWVAVRCDRELGEAFNRYSQRMKKNKAIVRIAKKMLNRIRTVLLQNRPYIKSV